MNDRSHMMRALALAEYGLGTVSPNPVVGCIIVAAGEIVGEGWHARAGGHHAEVAALAAAGPRAKGATAFVTLEPCNHHGRTPPCAAALVEAGVREVIFAVADPNPVAAGGAAYLRERGVNVRSGVCEAEARFINRAWLHGLAHHRPYVIAKFAMSLDGRIATHKGDSKWITGETARRHAHMLRTQVDAIAVGVDTIIADDPALTAREGATVTHAPLRVVLDSSGRTPQTAAVFNQGGSGTLICATDRAPRSRLEAYRKLGADIAVLSAGPERRADPRAILDTLFERDVRSLLVEGGGGAHGAFFDAGLVDEVWAFVAPMIIGGGSNAVAGNGPDNIAEALRLESMCVERLGSDLLIRGRTKKAGAPRRNTAPNDETLPTKEDA